MSKTSKVTFRNIETDKQKGKKNYRERVEAAELAEREIYEFKVEPSEDYPENEQINEID